MINWRPDPIILSAGPLHVRWYGLMFLASFTAGYYLFKWMCHVEKKPADHIDELLFYVTAGTIIGARLGHCLFYEPQYFLQHPLEIFAVWQGGLASHGGGLGVVIAIWLFTRKYEGLTFFWIIDRAAPLVALAGVFIRIGNLMNSEIIGKPTEVPWAFIFERVDMIPRHPTQIYESVTYAVTALIGGLLYKKFKARPPEGLLLGSILTCIFLGRIVWEFFKENQEPFEAGMFLNMGQLLSVPFVVVGMYLIGRALKRAESMGESHL